MTRDDLFNTNASIVRDLARAVSENAPDAHILIISSKLFVTTFLSVTRAWEAIQLIASYP